MRLSNTEYRNSFW